ncbi:EamA family transporter [Pokkaliibacter sp. CJK22405]|uniref:EamA family transporter n=1 Tax=Pokkaliibacter sp. CJK22405 TaxID=3384615 RepID=UPI0039853E99
MVKTTQIAMLSALLGLISVQTGAAFAKSLFPLIGADGVAAVRLGISSIVLALVLRPWRLWALKTIKPLHLVLYGLMLGLMNVLIYRAFSYIPVSIAVSIEVIGPLAVALLGSRKKQDLLWIALSVLGLVLLPWGNLDHGLDYRGVGFALAAAFCWALYVVMGTRVASGGSQSVASGMLVAALFIVPMGAGQAGAALMSPSMLMLGLLVALLSSVFPYVLDMVAMQRLPSRVFGVLLSGSPAVSAVAGWVVLGETLSMTQICGIGAITLACAGCAYLSGKARDDILEVIADPKEKAHS